MRVYRIVIVAGAGRAIAKLPRHVQPVIVAAIEALAREPRPRGSKKLTGPGGNWRIRVGGYRVIYTIDDGVLIVTVDESVITDVQNIGGHVLTVVAGPGAKSGFRSNTFFQH